MSKTFEELTHKEALIYLFFHYGAKDLANTNYIVAWTFDRVDGNWEEIQIRTFKNLTNEEIEEEFNLAVNRYSNIAEQLIFPAKRISYITEDKDLEEKHFRDFFEQYGYFIKIYNWEFSIIKNDNFSYKLVINKEVYYDRDYISNQKEEFYKRIYNFIGDNLISYRELKEIISNYL